MREAAAPNLQPPSDSRLPEPARLLPSPGASPRCGRRRSVADEATDPRPVALVVDDQAPIRAILDRFLERSGFATVLARDAREALSLLETDPRRLGLVLTDLALPDLDGVDLVRCIRDRWPRIRIVVASGLLDDERVQILRELGVDRFLPKPFRGDDVRAAVSPSLTVPPNPARPPAEIHP